MTLNSVDFSGRPFHFIGVGGIGMSAIAHVLAKRQLPVSGSDLRLSPITQRLQAQGVHIFWSQEASNLMVAAQGLPNQVRPISHNGNGSTVVTNGVTAQPEVSSSTHSDSLLPQVVCSTAINVNNPEYQAALDLGCPIFHRSDLLVALMNEHKGIAVAGTHGKTTTSSMLGYLLLKAGIDPTIVIGGEVSAWEGNAYVGESDYMVAEADESDGSLAKLSAYIGIVTNIELDHPDHYSSLDEVVDIFTSFAQQCEMTVGCIDCETVRSSLKPTISYSLRAESGADYRATDIRETAQKTVACIWEQDKLLGDLTLGLLGQHNLSNALAAVAVARQLGVEFETIASIMASFEGAKRRYDKRGFHHNILFVDDYAHHPSEIRATLSAARMQSTEALPGVPARRVVAVFQPHRYSRTHALLGEFATAFGDADCVIVTDIYGAGEENRYGVSSQGVADTIAEHHDQVLCALTLDDVQETLKGTLQPGDIVLFLTAGNLNRLIPAIMQDYQDIESQQQPEEVLSRA